MNKGNKGKSSDSGGVSRNYNILSCKLDEIIAKKPVQPPPRKKIEKKETSPEILLLGTVKGSSEVHNSRSESRNSTKDDVYLSPNVPDRSKSDYYCKICDSHMNSANMWESHITGKRHLKNVKSMKQGTLVLKPSPVEEKKVKGRIHATVARQISETNEAVVGLDYICEIHRSPDADPTYACYLCQGSFTVLSILDHIITSKHRLNYLKNVDKKTCAMLDSMKLTKSAMDALISDKAIEWQVKVGRGEMEIKMEKPKSDPVPVPKRRRRESSEDDDDDDDYHYSSRKSSRHENVKQSRRDYDYHDREPSPGLSRRDFSYRDREPSPVLSRRDFDYHDRGPSPVLSRRDFDYHDREPSPVLSRRDFDYHDRKQSPVPSPPPRDDSLSLPMCEPALPMSRSSESQFLRHSASQAAPSSMSAIPQRVQPSIPQHVQSSRPQHVRPSILRHVQPSIPEQVQPSIPPQVQPSMPAPAVNASGPNKSQSAAKKDEDIFSKVKNSSDEIKLQLLKELSSPKILDEAVADAVMKCVNSLTHSLLQYKIQNLPAQLQMRLVQEIVANNPEDLTNIQANILKNKPLSSIDRGQFNHDSHHDVHSGENSSIILSTANPTKVHGGSSNSPSSDIKAERSRNARSEQSSSSHVGNHMQKDFSCVEELVATLRNQKILPSARYDTSASHTGPQTNVSSFSTHKISPLPADTSETVHHEIPGLDLVSSEQSTSTWRTISNEVADARPPQQSNVPRMPSYASVPRVRQYENTQAPAAQTSRPPYVAVSSTTYRRVPQGNLNETRWQKRQNFDESSSFGY